MLRHPISVRLLGCTTAIAASAPGLALAATVIPTAEGAAPGTNQWMIGAIVLGCLTILQAGGAVLTIFVTRRESEASLMEIRRRITSLENQDTPSGEMHQNLEYKVEAIRTETAEYVKSSTDQMGRLDRGLASVESEVRIQSQELGRIEGYLHQIITSANGHGQ